MPGVYEKKIYMKVKFKCSNHVASQLYIIANQILWEQLNAPLQSTDDMIIHFHYLNVLNFKNRISHKFAINNRRKHYNLSMDHNEYISLHKFMQFNGNPDSWKSKIDPSVIAVMSYVNEFFAMEILKDIQHLHS